MMTRHAIYWLVTTGVLDGTAVHTTHLFNTLICSSLPSLQYVEPRSINIIILAGSIQRGNREDVKIPWVFKPISFPLNVHQR